MMLRCGSCCKYLLGFISSNTNRICLATSSYRKLIHRFTHNDNTSAQVFKRSENEYYHAFLAGNKKYTGSIAYLDYLTVQKPPSEITFLDENLENEHGTTLVTYLHSALLHSHESPEILVDPRFEKFCDILISKIENLNEDYVLNLLKILTLWDESKRSNLFFRICKAADKMLLVRYRMFGFDRCLQVNDHFYRLQVLRYSEFVWNSMKRLWRDPNRLTSAQVVHAMFLVNTHRVWHPAVNLYNVEGYLLQATYELTAEECAILALAFFKTHTKIKNVELLDLLYRKLECRLSNIDDIPLTAFLKLFRLCSYYCLAEKQQNLLSQLTNFVDKHSYFCCTHIALLGTGLHLWNREIYEKIAHQFVKQISTIRLKDIERTLFAFESFNFEPKNQPDVYELALNEVIKREDETAQFPREFYSTISYLILKGYYNFQLVDKMLSEDYIKKAFKRKTDLNKHNVHPCILVISNSMKIDCPEYSGTFLSESLTQDLYMGLTSKIPKENDRRLPICDKCMFEAKSLLIEILGGVDFVHYTYVTPHLYRPDLLFCLNDGKPVKLPESILSSKYVDIKIPSVTEDWYVVTFLGINTVIFNSDKPLGNTVTKMRHLNKLGYKVLPLVQNEWNRKSNEGKKQYLRNLIQQSRQSKKVLK